jgi:hypothetical protein
LIEPSNETTTNKARCTGYYYHRKNLEGPVRI